MKQITTILLAGSSALLLSACGGGSSSDLPIVPPEATTPPPVSTPEIIDSGYSFPIRYAPYQIKGDEFYYGVENCELYDSYKTEWTLYEDNTMEVEYETSYSGTYTGVCDVTEKFVPIEASDGPIYAEYIDKYYYYDNDSKLYYIGSCSFENPLLEVLNDGQSVRCEGQYSYSDDVTAPLDAIVEEVPL